MALKDVEKIIKQLNEIKDVVAHSVISWTKDHLDIHITHQEATKKHALEVLLKMLGVTSEETIAFGDSENDLPLFEIAGYKVAMSNGADRLKAAADFIALHAEADGLAEAIEKLVI